MEVGESGIGESGVGVGVGDGHRGQGKGCLRGWVCGFQEGDELVGEFDELVAVEGRGAGGVVEGDARHDCGGGGGGVASVLPVFVTAWWRLKNGRGGCDVRDKLLGLCYPATRICCACRWWCNRGGTPVSIGYRG